MNYGAARLLREVPPKMRCLSSIPAVLTPGEVLCFGDSRTRDYIKPDRKLLILLSEFC